MTEDKPSMKQWTADEIRELRKSLELDQDAFAKILGIDVRTLIKWETASANYRQPSAPGVHALNGLLNEVQRVGPKPIAATLASLLSGAVAGAVGAGLGGAAVGLLAGPVGGLGVLVALGIRKLLESKDE